MRAFTKKGKGMHNKNYWERLEEFKLYSIQRRNERYKIIYVWKSINGLVPSLGIEWNPIIISRHGPKLIIKHPIGQIGSVNTLVRNSLKNFGVRLFNHLPVSLRLYNVSLAGFKARLDMVLSQCPDQPATENMVPEINDIFGNPSNSLIDWMRTCSLHYFDNFDFMEKAQPSPM